jgi:hypothetical protein
VAEQLETVEVRPQKNGKWKVSGVADSFDDRSAAETAAKVEAGQVEAFDKDGNSLGFTPPTKRILLLRLDGKVAGELGAQAPRRSQNATVVDLIPAVEADGAEKVGA